MSKIVINNTSSFSDEEALQRVAKVVSHGRISNFGNDYCFVTLWTDGCMVQSVRNEKSDTFHVLNDERNDNAK